MGGRGEATLVTTFASSIPGIYPSVQLVHSPNLDLFVSFMRLLRNLSALPGSHERLPGNSGALPRSLCGYPKIRMLYPETFVYPRKPMLYPRT